MFPRPFLLAVAALALAPAAAQARQSPEDLTLAAMNVCYEAAAGRPITPAATQLGFTPRPNRTETFNRVAQGRTYEISLRRTRQDNGAEFRMCAVAVWGRLDNPIRVRDSLVARGRAGGYAIPAPRPLPGGGSELMMTLPTARGLQGLAMTINEQADRTKGASYVLVHGWFP